MLVPRLKSCFLGNPYTIHIIEYKKIINKKVKFFNYRNYLFIYMGKLQGLKHYDYTIGKLITQSSLFINFFFIIYKTHFLVRQIKLKKNSICTTFFIHPKDPDNLGFLTQNPETLFSGQSKI